MCSLKQRMLWVLSNHTLNLHLNKQIYSQYIHCTWKIMCSASYIVAQRKQHTAQHNTCTATQNNKKTNKKTMI